MHVALVLFDLPTVDLVLNKINIKASAL